MLAFKDVDELEWMGGMFVFVIGWVFYQLWTELIDVSAEEYILRE